MYSKLIRADMPNFRMSIARSFYCQIFEWEFKGYIALLQRYPVAGHFKIKHFKMPEQLQTLKQEKQNNIGWLIL